MVPWRRTFASGLIVLVPILVCVYPLAWLYGVLIRIPVLQGIQPPVLRVLLIVLVFGLYVMSIGYLMRTTVGGLVDSRIDATVNRFPGIRLFHSGIKEAISTVVLRRDVVGTPVKVELWADMYLTAFRTGTRTPDGRESLFVPGAPDVTSGLVVEVRSEDVIETDETLMDALVRLVSCGFGETGGQPNPQNQRPTSEE